MKKETPATSYLGGEIRLWQAIAVHDILQVLQHVVEDLVQLLAKDGQGRLRGEPPRVQLGLGETLAGREAKHEK